MLRYAVPLSLDLCTRVIDRTACTQETEVCDDFDVDTCEAGVLVDEDEEDSIVDDDDYSWDENGMEDSIGESSDSDSDSDSDSASLTRFSTVLTGAALLLATAAAAGLARV